MPRRKGIEKAVLSTKVTQAEHDEFVALAERNGQNKAARLAELVRADIGPVQESDAPTGMRPVSVTRVFTGSEPGTIADRVQEETLPLHEGAPMTDDTGYFTAPPVHDVTFERPITVAGEVR